MTARKDFAAILKTAFAAIDDLADVWVEASQDDKFVDARVTCLVSQTSIGPLPAAPLSHRAVGMTLTLISPSPDTDTAADELEPIVDAVLDWLDDQNLTHGVAVVDTFGPGERQQFAYRIPVTVPAKKKD